MGLYQNIRSIIQTKLQNVSDIQAVYRYPRMKFTEGYPAATITPSEGASDWETNREDERIYSYDINIFYETKDRTLDTTLDRMMDVVDDVLDEFASDKQLTGVVMPSGKTMLTCNPIFAGWGSTDDNEHLVATIKLQVRISIDIS